VLGGVQGAFVCMCWEGGGRLAAHDARLCGAGAARCSGSPSAASRSRCARADLGSPYTSYTSPVQGWPTHGSRSARAELRMLPTVWADVQVDCGAGSMSEPPVEAESASESTVWADIRVDCLG
jgi:hypothetical protein